MPSLSSEQLGHFIFFQKEKKVNKDTILFDEGENAKYIYFIQEGSVALTTKQVNKVAEKKNSTQNELESCTNFLKDLKMADKEIGYSFHQNKICSGSSHIKIPVYLPMFLLKKLF